MNYTLSRFPIHNRHITKALHHIHNDALRLWLDPKNSDLLKRIQPARRGDGQRVGEPPVSRDSFGSTAATSEAASAKPKFEL